MSSPLHVAIIMDGNGRWAQAHGWPRVEGHRVGAETVRRIVEVAPSLGIGTLTLYAFSADNWKRPPLEVRALMKLFQVYLEREVRLLAEKSVRFTAIGRRDRLPAHLVRDLEAAEATTAHGTRLNLRLAVDYSSRDALVEAARQAPDSREALQRLLGSACDVDILIRTGGEQRLSDFLLWESAYAELFFTKTAWPDFGESELRSVVDEFNRRQRRFGGIEPMAAYAVR